MRRLLLSLILVCTPLVVTAKEVKQDAADETLALKFWVQGTTLVFDTESKVKGDQAEMTVKDIKRLLAVLTNNPDITELELNSTGGSVFAGDEMARIVIDFELNTVVSGECSSSCVNIFLGGKQRRMYLGSKIGFHQRSWSASAIKDYYQTNRDSNNWATPFDFASWSYKDTQAEIQKDLTFFVDRGVDPGFAIKAKKVRASGLWYPNRLELRQSGVLRD